MVILLLPCIISEVLINHQGYHNTRMEILRSVIGGSETVSQVSSAETIERLVDRVNSSTLIDDRRDACRALRAMSKKFRQVTILPVNNVPA